MTFNKQGLRRLRKEVGIVFQDPDNQLFSADVYRDISFGAVNLGLPEAEVRRRVEAAMERTGVAHLRDKPTHALSFGQKKRARKNSRAPLMWDQGNWSSGGCLLPALSDRRMCVSGPPTVWQRRCF